MVAGRRSFEGVLPVAELPRLVEALADEKDADALPGDCEPLLLEGGALSPRKVIGDELLLALPLVPVKPGSQMLQGEWSTPGEHPQAAESGEAVMHPFADLRKLIEAREKHR